MHPDIVVNARFLYRKITGVERYAGEILSRLKDRVRCIDPELRLAGVVGHVWEQVILPGQVDRDEILWSPANTGPLALTNQVITVHDLSFIDHPDWYHPAFAAWYKFLIPKLARRARLITTVSSYVKIRISETFQIYKTKIEVIPGGVDTQKFKPASTTELSRVCRKYDLPCPYILIAGSINPRKNLANALAAWKEIHRLHPDMHLLVVGSRSDLFSSSGIDKTPSGVRLVGYIDDADLPALYGGATAYLLASLYEGFGLTVLEAMACGTPVVAANTTAIPEVVGEAGRLFDPLDVDEMVSAINEVISDESLAGSLVQKGYQRAQLFTWERSAQMLFDVLKRELTG
jgi:glycosyltransferase involved in cell wall biosynthesis